MVVANAIAPTGICILIFSFYYIIINCRDYDYSRIIAVGAIALATIMFDMITNVYMANAIAMVRHFDYAQCPASRSLSVVEGQRGVAIGHQPTPRYAIARPPR